MIRCLLLFGGGVGSDGAGQQLSGNQLQEAMKEYRRVQPVGSKYVEYQRLQQEVSLLLIPYSRASRKHTICL